jgi:DNA-binding CsgD family transcriptional regulator
MTSNKLVEILPKTPRQTPEQLQEAARQITALFEETEETDLAPDEVTSVSYAQAMGISQYTARHRLLNLYRKGKMERRPVSVNRSQSFAYRIKKAPET